MSEGITGTSRRDSPAAAIVGVGPQKVAHGSLMGNFLDTVQGSDVVQSIDARRQTTVETEDLVIDQGSQGEVIEEIGKVLPDVGVAVLAETLIVEAVDLCDLPGLVVASKDGDALGVSDLEGN